MRRLLLVILFALLCVLIGIFIYTNDNSYNHVLKKHKELIFSDDCTQNWQDKWLLDGTLANIENTENGMSFMAGPEFGNDTSHAVLWAKENFFGNIMIQYEYTRTDTAIRCVNILYFLATGKDVDGYDKDIFSWNKQREVPHMRTYFNHVNTYHISYAAFGVNNNNQNEDYIRMRRYMPIENNGLKNTEIEGDYFNTGLFATGETYEITVVKYDAKVWMNIESKTNNEHHLLCEWDTSEYPELKEGRIGLRHMYTRGAIYKDFKVWEIKE